MNLQLIFVVESDKKSKSDWIYVKDTIEHFYRYDRAHTKFSPVYMGGKGNYKAKEREIKSLISQYASSSKGNQSKVVLCLDCDDYDIKEEDSVFLDNAEKYCKKRDYEFVWFCRDIETVYLGRKVENSRKTKEAAAFKAKKLIGNVDSGKLSAEEYLPGTSNIMKILDKYLERK